MKKRTHQLLHLILTLQFASPINLFSYEAKTHKGSLLQVNKDIKHYLDLGFIHRIPTNVPKTHSKNIDRQTKDWFAFYSLTKDGAREIGREDEYKQHVIKSLNNLEHESMKIDVARSFIENYPDYDFDFDYSSSLNKIRPDILVRAKNLHDRREFTFLVEIERKKEMSRTHREKILKYEKFSDKELFINNGLSDKTKVLVVFSNFVFNGFYRPLFFNSPVYKKEKLSLHKSFDEYLAGKKSLTNKRYRFKTFDEFQDIKHFYLPSGDKVEIM